MVPADTIAFAHYRVTLTLPPENYPLPSVWRAEDVEHGIELEYTITPGGYLNYPACQERHFEIQTRLVSPPDSALLYWVQRAAPDGSYWVARDLSPGPVWRIQKKNEPVTLRIQSTLGATIQLDTLVLKFLPTIPLDAKPVANLTPTAAEVTPTAAQVTPTRPT